MSEMIKDFALSEMQKSGQERAGVGHEKVEGPSQEIKPCTRARLEHAAIVVLFTENAEEEEEESVASPPLVQLPLFLCRQTTTADPLQPRRTDSPPSAPLAAAASRPNYRQRAREADERRGSEIKSGDGVRPCTSVFFPLRVCLFFVCSPPPFFLFVCCCRPHSFSLPVLFWGFFFLARERKPSKERLCGAASSGLLVSGPPEQHNKHGWH